MYVSFSARALSKGVRRAGAVCNKCSNNLFAPSCARPGSEFKRDAAIQVVRKKLCTVKERWDWARDTRDL